MKKQLLLFLFILSGQILLSQNYKLYRKQHLNSGIIFDIAQDTSSGLYWIATETGLLSYNGSEYKKEDIISSGKTIISIQINNGNLLFTTKDGLIGVYNFLHERVKYYLPEKNNLYFDQIKSLFFHKTRAHQYSKLIENDGKFYEFKLLDKLYQKKEVAPESVISEDYRLLNALEKEEILAYFEGKQGVFYLTEAKLKLFTKQGKLLDIDNNINFNSIFIDTDENLILSNYNGNLFVYKNEDIEKVFSFRKNISKIRFTDMNNFYLADEDYNLYRLENNKERSIFINKGKKMIDSRINTFGGDRIFFNYSYLDKYANHVIKNMNTIVLDTFLYENKKAYIGTGYADVKAIVGNNIYRLLYGNTEENSIIFSKVTDLKILGDIVYISTIHGLHCFNFKKRQVNKMYERNHIIKKHHISLLRKTKDKLLFISDKADLFSLNCKNNSYRPIFKGRDLNIRFINDMEFASDSVVYLASNIGLIEVVFDKSFGQLRSTEIYNFTGNQSIENIQDIDIVGNTLYFSSDQIIYRKTINIKKELEARTKIIYSINNSNLQFDSIEKSYKIAGNDRNLKFRFYSPTFNVIYQYQKIKTLLIKDGDTLLTDYPEGNFINYENLDVGSYKFVFFSRDKGGRYMLSAVFKLEIIPFYFETAYFRIILLSLLLFVLILIIGFFNLRLKHRLILYENENYNMKLLKAQLRPHFLYNTLNTLKSIVYHQKSDLALELIDKFTLFLRHNLSVDNILINSLESEINEIENYVEIENIRTNKRIRLKYDIKDLGQFSIPSNILQPIVENAIVHGLEDDKILNIEIEVLRFKKHLEIFIRNDGKPIDIRKNGNSFALNSIITRLQIFNGNKIKDSLKLENTIRKEKSYVEYTIKIKTLKHENSGH